MVLCASSWIDISPLESPWDEVASYVSVKPATLCSDCACLCFVCQRLFAKSFALAFRNESFQRNCCGLPIHWLSGI